MELQLRFVPNHSAVLYRMSMKDYSKALGEVTLLTNIVRCCCLIAKTCPTFCDPKDSRVLSKMSISFDSEIFPSCKYLISKCVCVWPTDC